MPILRNAILKLMPKRWRDDAIRDSQTWITDCTACGHQSNVWALGGLRWKAYGKPLTLMRCIGCGKAKMQRIHKP